MNRQQPNFEKIKTKFLNAALYSSKLDFALLMEQVKSFKLLPLHDFRKMNFHNELNNWLDGVDIRCVGQLINATVELGGKLPDWMINNKFTINYNKHGFMDIQKL